MTHPAKAYDLEGGRHHGAVRAYKAALARAGFLTLGEQIVDAWTVSMPKRRNTDGETADIRPGRIPADWATSRQARTEGARCELNGQVLQGEAG